MTSTATTNFDRALALQTFFRDPSVGGFRYSTDIQGGQGEDAIDTFLEERVGYCEQFAGTFAAMARSLGIPARVAVGFTWGEEDPNQPGRYQVLGRNAHAWPEVYLAGYGWVPFEPTPGRGNPDAESYTGVAASQEDDPLPADDHHDRGPGRRSRRHIHDRARQRRRDRAGRRSRIRRRLDLLVDGLRVVVVLMAAAVVYLLAVPGSLAVRRRRRRARAAGSPAAEVGVAWTEATEVLAGAGVRSRIDETHGELAGRAALFVPPVAEPMARLAATADAAAYGPAPTEADGAAAEQAAAEVRDLVDADLGPRGRFRRLLDPRPLWQGRAGATAPAERSPPPARSSTPDARRRPAGRRRCQIVIGESDRVSPRRAA